MRLTPLSSMRQLASLAATESEDACAGGRPPVVRPGCRRGGPAPDSRGARPALGRPRPCASRCRWVGLRRRRATRLPKFACIRPGPRGRRVAGGHAAANGSHLGTVALDRGRQRPTGERRAKARVPEPRVGPPSREIGRRTDRHETLHRQFATNLSRAVAARAHNHIQRPFATSARRAAPAGTQTSKLASMAS